MPAKPPTMSASKGLPRLREQHEKAKRLVDLVSPPLGQSEVNAWGTQTRHYLEAIFGEDSSKVSSVMNAGRHRVLDINMSDRDLREYYSGIMQARLDQLQALIEILEAEVADEAPIVPVPQASPRASSKKVFIVHGHDETAKQTLARFIGKLKLQEVILHEQPSGSKTIIEKFEKYAEDVAYAVVLLTPDDRGGTAAQPFEEQKSRARQNVVFELGFFVGALGRDRVCALHKPGTELPSDVSGVVYITMDPHDGWKLPLAKEIRQVIPTVDMNDAM